MQGIEYRHSKVLDASLLRTTVAVRARIRLVSAQSAGTPYAPLSSDAPRSIYEVEDGDGNSGVRDRGNRMPG
jgi:hypothetical protein